MNHEPAPAFPGLTDQERSWGMLAHLSALAGIVFPVLGAVLGPLIVWLARREHSAFVNDQGREALNFNISVLLAGVVCGLLTWVFIGFLLGLLLFIYWLVMTIVAGVKAGEGVAYRHAYTLRLVG
ncbi:MAG TPA: DUF4870 domain-containing protein [Steroidobacteraceae bacterium]|nr:DUF4870 domain-containing protein [Steroidobacteraceae bacterium]